MSETQTKTPPPRPMVGRIQSDQEHGDLLTYHLTVIRQELAKVETAKGPLEEAKAEVSDANENLTKAFNTAKGDLGRGYTRKYLEGLVADAKLKVRELVELENQRARDKIILNQPVFGQQPELFNGAETPTAARDEMMWEMEGYQRGRRGDLDELQDGDPPTFNQAIMRGFRAGQAATMEEYARGAELRKAAETPNVEPPVNLDDSEKDEEDDLDDAADRLKASGFMETGGGDAEPDAAPAGETETFEAPAAELEGQTTRRAVKGARAAAPAVTH